MGDFKEKLKKITTREYTKEEIINVILYATIISVPLILTGGSLPFTNGKLAALYILGALAIVFGFRNMIFPLFNEKKIALLFLITILIVSIFSPDKKVAFLGNPTRGEGFIVIAIYIILFLLAAKYLKINKIGINIIFMTASVISLYGVFQFYGIDPIQKILYGVVLPEYGSISTLGNRNFVSNYICIFLFLSSAMFIFKKEKKYLFFAGIQFTGLLCTLTRGGWLAFLIYALVGLIFIIKRKDCLKRALIILIVFTIIFGGLNLTTNNTVINRGDKDLIISEEGNMAGTVGGRLEILRICWNSFKVSPFIGYGPDNLKTRLLDDCPEDSVLYLLQHGVGIDKAHNEFVEYAVSCGIFTLIIYLGLLGLIIKGLIINIKDDLNKVLLLTLIGYLVQGLFNISTIGVAPLYWIFLGYCVKKINREKLIQKNVNLA